MITGKDSWKALVVCGIILLITCGCGGICAAGYQSYFFGIANILFGLLATYLTYKHFKALEEK